MKDFLGVEIFDSGIFMVSIAFLSPFEKWSDYVHSCISGTHGMKVTPLGAGTKPLIPG